MTLNGKGRTGEEYDAQQEAIKEEDHSQYLHATKNRLLKANFISLICEDIESGEYQKLDETDRQRLLTIIKLLVVHAKVTKHESVAELTKLKPILVKTKPLASGEMIEEELQTIDAILSLI